MGNLRRYYYNNKAKIWKTILIIVSILAIIQLINYFVKRDNENTLQNQKTNTVQNTIVNNTSLTTDKSSTTGTKVDENKLEKEVNVVEQFLDLCNNQEFVKAYELLSDECKENVFDNYEKFKNNYCDKIFTSKKTYTMENWAGSTYKVRIAEDILATGQTSNSGVAIQEFITIVTNNGEKRLNINNYIGKTEFKSSNTQKGITIKILSKNTYKDYEIYNIEVTNNTENTIYLDDGEDTSNVYIEDSNGVKHEAASSELIYSTLKINRGQTRKYSIKFTNTYISNRKISALVFDKLILNYDEYIKNPENYKDTISFRISM